MLQEGFLQEGILQEGQEGILQEGVFPTLVHLWHKEQLSPAGGPVSDLLLSLLQALPAHVASSLQLLPTDEVCLVDIPRHWQVLATQPFMLEPEVFQAEVISSNVKVSASQLSHCLHTATSHSGHHCTTHHNSLFNVTSHFHNTGGVNGVQLHAAYRACHVQVKTGAALMMLLSLIDPTDLSLQRFKLTRAAEAGLDTVALEQMLQTINSWSAPKADASLERDMSQSSQTSGESPAVQPQADSPEIATTLPFVAAARVLETLVYWHRRSAQEDEYARSRVRFNRELLIAGFALSSCRRKTMQKVAQPHEEDPYKTSYDGRLSPVSSEEERLLSWLEQFRTEFDIDISKRAEVISMVDITPGQLLQLSSKLQKCQMLAEGWFTSTQGNAFKLFVEMLRDCITLQPSPVQHSYAERNALIR